MTHTVSRYQIPVLSSSSPNRCIIDLAAIRHNLTLLQDKCGSHCRLMCMIKASAYGTDALRMAQFLNTCGIDLLGVSCMDEAISLRRAGVSQSIFVIHVPSYEIEKALQWDVEFGIDSRETLLAIESLAPIIPLKVHLHIDTGMKRFGISPENCLSFAQELDNSPYVDLVGIMTHLACADNPEQDAFTLHQISQFDAVISALQRLQIDPPWKHAANSAGVLRFRWPQYNSARVGLAAYGLHNTTATQTLPLHPAIALHSRIVALHTCQAGDTIGYGRQYLVEKENETIATVSIGYHDGLHRSHRKKGVVLIRGKKAPIVGNICMDFMMVDISEVPEAAVGDSVLIFGEDENGHYLAPEEVAMAGDSIVHELISCLGPRVQRIFMTETHPCIGKSYDLEL